MNWFQKKLASMSANGQLDEARQAGVREEYRSSVDIATKAKQAFEQIADDKGILNSLIVLGDAHLGLKEFDASASDYEAARNMLAKIAEDKVLYDLSEVAISLGAGEVRRHAGSDDDAEKQYRQALAAMERQGIDENYLPEAAVGLYGLALLLDKKNSNVDAEQYYERAFKAVEYPPNGFKNLYTLSLQIMNSYSEFLKKQQKIDRAKEIDEHLVELKKAHS